MSPRLFAQIVSVEARAQMSYRVDFWINAVVGFAAHFALMYFLWQAMFRESGTLVIGGYDFHGILLYYAAVILFGKLVRGPEMQGGISEDIYDGGLNRYLVFPTSYFWVKYAQNVGSLLPAFVQLGLFGVWFPLLLDVPPDIDVTVLTVAMALVSVAAANLLYFVMGFPIRCVAFWADNVWSLVVTLRFTAGLLGGFLIPLSVFPAWSRGVLEWLPFRYLYDFPANVLMGRVPAAAWVEGLAVTLAWTFVIGLVGRAVWRRGTLQYSGIGI